MLIPRLPWWYTCWVGLQGYLRWLYCKWKAGQINVQGIFLVLEVSGQMVPSLLQNTGSKNKDRWSEKQLTHRMVAQWLSYHTTEPLTTAAQRPCRYAAAELVALFRSAPLPSSAPRRQGRWRAHTLAVHPSVSSIHYWPPKEWQLQPRPAPCAPLTVPTHIKVPQYKPYI